jgi:hypothetical protein
VIENELIRRSVRLLAAIHELHKEGFQNLGIFTGMSSSGAHWRLSLVPFDCLFLDERNHVQVIVNEKWQEALHSSGQTGNTYFGWEDVSSLNARELAQTIKSRLPRLVEHCRAVNFENAGWLNYVYGQAELENLPVMYRDYFEPSKGIIASTGKNLLVAPYNQIHTLNGRRFIYKKGDKLTPKQRDWHSVYKQIIDNIRSSEIAEFPCYPINSINDFEFNAYWEGAIYYIDQILNIHRIDEFLLRADDVSRSSETWASFFAIYNTHGQFIFLKAFLIRYMLSQKNDKYSLKPTEVKKWQKWLSDFENSHAEPLNINSRLPNPYFGGNNPLHLGGILVASDRAGKDTLISL